MKKLLLLLLLLPIFAFAQNTNNADFCITRTNHSPITATSNSTIRGDSINCGGASTPAITIPSGVHDVHITKCWLGNSTHPQGVIYVNSTCYNITIDTCYITTGIRGINVVQATNNIVIKYNRITLISDNSAHTNGGGSHVQLNNCNGTGIEIAYNDCYTPVIISKTDPNTANLGVGDILSIYQSNGTSGSYILVHDNCIEGGSSNLGGYAGFIGGDVGGSFQNFYNNKIKNGGFAGFQIVGGHDIIANNNLVYGDQLSYNMQAITFGYFGGTPNPPYNITCGGNKTNNIDKYGNAYSWFISGGLSQPTGWTTNTAQYSVDGTVTSALLPDPLWSPCVANPPPVISYPTPQTLHVGSSYTINVTSSGGAVVSYSGSVPPGLTLNTVTGQITGVPTTVASASNYVITATNTSSSFPFTISFTVVPAVPIISYPTPNVYTVGNSVSLSPTNTGGAPSSYSISATPPSGTSFNTTTGVLSGTLTTAAPSTTWTISATNGGGTGTAPLNITVNPIPLAKPIITYTSPQVYTTGQTITPLSPTNTGGAIVSFTVVPALPLSLSLNTSNGIISGTASAVTPTTIYNVIASNSAGSSTFPLSITINAPVVVAPNISYSPNSQTLTYGTPMTVMSPINSGGTVTTWGVSPALPSGLNFTNGVISGTPRTVFTATGYVVSAQNSAGTSNATVTLTSNKALLTITAISTSKLQGQPNPPLQIFYTGLVNGDTGITVPPTISTTCVTGSPAGTYPVTLSGGSSAFYTLTLVDGVLSVYSTNTTVTDHHFGGLVAVP